ncbi:hypothetical protein EUX98_g3515 [Antrodiella citrinella]|uniref:Glucose-methanol-choline oxidoreductase N-terminal domain-containing protein n=1 Tax=Antrodiella citrinella TaxID=2447956 RepID=A0A4S4MWC1_9APHY|nr:hypothetical protein EUX98_g3515 [Antrodiella citrinella]
MSALEDVLAKGSFDYIVIGGGTAGLTLASRLTEDPHNSVLVLEAGNDNTSDANILRPASYGAHFGNDAYSWGRKTSEQSHAANNQIVWHCGKGLGGSSGINFMIYMRPSSDCVDDFERLGNPGWNSKHLERLLCKVEGYVPPSQPDARFDTHWQAARKLGTHGPLKISFPPGENELEFIVLEAFKKAGIPVARDPFGGDITGVWMAPNAYDLVTHTRSYSATAYYLPHRDRPNFTVLLNALVARAITQKAHSGFVTATGVEFFHGGKKYVVHANKEVIVCAGALKSAHILELSGIGRKEVLEKINVPVQVDLNGVGTNVQDHVCNAMSFELKDDVPYDTSDILRDPKVAAEHIRLHSTGAGIHTSGLTNILCVPPELVSPNAPKVYQRAKEHILKHWYSYSPEVQAQYRIRLDRIDKKIPGTEILLLKGYFSMPNRTGKGKKYITLLNILNNALSRGTIHAISNDPLEDPEYDPHYLEITADLDIMVEQVHLSRRLASTSPLKEIIARELLPGPDVQTDEQIREWIASTIGTPWHIACTCSMMPRDKGGVVDPQLKVYGTTNIRVADLSIIPIHVASHPMSVVYAIGEYAAEVIMGTSQL